MIVPGVTTAGEIPSMLRNVLARPVVSPEYGDQGWSRVTGPKGCSDCTSAAWRADVDSRRNFAGLGTSLGRTGVRLGTLDWGAMSPGWVAFWSGLSLLSAGASAYHGYRRNRSVGWAVAWGVLGGLFPIITPAVAIAQGYGKRARGR